MCVCVCVKSSISFFIGLYQFMPEYSVSYAITHTYTYTNSIEMRTHFPHVLSCRERKRKERKRGREVNYIFMTIRTFRKIHNQNKESSPTKLKVAICCVLLKIVTIILIDKIYINKNFLTWNKNPALLE